MPSILKRAYPSYRLDEVCKVCRGNSQQTLDKYRCVVCKKTHNDYIKAGLEIEVDEFDYLKKTWDKCQVYKQLSTGIKKLDFVITMLFGNPHNNNWRNYSIATNVNMDDFIVLRIARVA